MQTSCKEGSEAKAKPPARGGWLFRGGYMNTLPQIVNAVRYCGFLADGYLTVSFYFFGGSGYIHIKVPCRTSKGRNRS